MGREGLLTELEAAFSRARAGQGGVVLLSGETGIGKSRLLQAFTQRLEGRAHVLSAVAYPDSRATPYQPLVDALRPAITQNPAWLEVAACCTDELMLLMPDLRALRAEPRPSQGSEGPSLMAGEAGRSRTRLFEALSQLVLGMASGSRPLVLCLDDLHWADGTTLDWLGFLARRLGGTRLLVVGTYNAEESAQVEGLRDSLDRGGNLTEFELYRLDRKGILQLLQGVQDQVPAHEAVADALYDATGGNPLYLLETIQALAEATCDIDDLDGVAEFCLPDALRDSVEARIGRLTARSRQVLEACAVMGSRVSFDQVQHDVWTWRDGGNGWPGRAVGSPDVGGGGFRDTASATRSSGQPFTRRWGVGAGAFCTAGRARRWNVCGLTMPRPWPGTLTWQASRDARRCMRWRLDGRPKRSLVTRRPGATLTARWGFWTSKPTTLRKAAAISANQRLRIEALFERGWALRLLGDMDAYASDVAEEARLAERLGDAGTNAQVSYRLAYAHRWFCRYDAALTAAEEGLRLSRDAADPLCEALCTREIGMAARELGDYDRGQAALDSAQQALAELGEVVLHLHTLGNLATLHLRHGDAERSLSLARQGLDLCDRMGLAFRTPTAAGGSGRRGCGTGRPRRGAPAPATRAWISPARSRTVPRRSWCSAILAGSTSVSGTAPRARERLGEALALAQAIGSCTEQSWLHAGLAEAHRLAGDRGQAEYHARAALQLATATGRVPDRDRANGLLARLSSTSEQSRVTSHTS